MNVRNLTGIGIAQALGAKPPRFHKCSSTYSRGKATHVILWFADDKYYACGNHQLGAINMGFTPAFLGLDEIGNPDDEEPEDYVCSRYDLAASRADRDNDMKREGL